MQILHHLRKFMKLGCQKCAASKMHKFLAEIIFMTFYSQMYKFYISKEINFMKRCIFKILIINWKESTSFDTQNHVYNYMSIVFSIICLPSYKKITFYFYYFFLHVLKILFREEFYTVNPHQ